MIFHSNHKVLQLDSIYKSINKILILIFKKIINLLSQKDTNHPFIDFQKKKGSHKLIIEYL